MEFIESTSKTGYGASINTSELSKQEQNHLDEHAARENGSLPGFNAFARPTCTCQVGLENEDIGPIEPDERLLSIYRNQLGPQFPFVVIPATVTITELEQSRPFLLKVVKMVASLQNRRSMWKQSYDVMRHISEAVIMGSKRSLDILQGILVFLGYYHYYCLAHGQFNNLTHLAGSMIEDLDLDRRPKLHDDFRSLAMDPEGPKRMTNDERRAVVGVWYMSSKFVPMPAHMRIETETFRQCRPCFQQASFAEIHEKSGLLSSRIEDCRGIRH